MLLSWHIRHGQHTDDFSQWSAVTSTAKSCLERLASMRGAAADSVVTSHITPFWGDIRKKYCTPLIGIAYILATFCMSIIIGRFYFNVFTFNLIYQAKTIIGTL